MAIIIVGTLTKDPDETRLFRMDWTAHIGVDEILMSTWEIPAGLTLVANGIIEGNTKTYMFLRGGTANSSYVLTNTVLLYGSKEILQRSCRLDVREH